MKLCVLFPGIGYHCGKPLLYYAGKLARSKGYEVIELSYTGFENNTKGNEDKMRDAAALAFRQSVLQLKNIGFSEYEKVVFIGKSIGTAACTEYRSMYGIKAECVLLTPLVQTFLSDTANCTAFHGTADQWADTAEIRRLCSENNVPLHEYEGGNHSLETGDVCTDIRTVLDVMKKLSELL